jgi:hypothetical protein
MQSAGLGWEADTKVGLLAGRYAQYRDLHHAEREQLLSDLERTVAQLVRGRLGFQP